jgi:hypothetical protein
MNPTSFPAHWRSLLCAALLALAGLHLAAADARADGMDFPRNALSWYFSGDAEKLWPHLGPTLREMAEDVEGLREASEDFGETMGRELAVLDEQLFDHPDGDGWQVYVRAVQHAEVGELFWLVIFSPAEREVGMIMPQPRQSVQILFPQVRLP